MVCDPLLNELGRPWHGGLFFKRRRWDDLEPRSDKSRMQRATASEATSCCLSLHHALDLPVVTRSPHSACRPCVPILPLLKKVSFFLRLLRIYFVQLAFILYISFGTDNMHCIIGTDNTFCMIDTDNTGLFYMTVTDNTFYTIDIDNVFCKTGTKNAIFGAPNIYFLIGSDNICHIIGTQIIYFVSLTPTMKVY